MVRSSGGEKHNDPIDRFERYVLEQNVATSEKLAEIVADVARLIDEDCAWAESSPLPEPEEAAYRVFDNNLVPPAIRPKVLES
jgi:TPP-dependent pyruvate/acetoin dehydrogenase alpha subunit